MAKKKRAVTPPIAIAVGKALAKQRKAAGKTQQNIAEEMEVSVETVSRLESGAILQTVDRLQQLSLILNCPITSFFWEESGDLARQAGDLADMIRILPERQRDKLLRCVAEMVKMLAAD